jgi:hypothetical protein
MLTDAQLRTTAVRLATAHIGDLDHDHPDVDKLLCLHHCEALNCERQEEDMDEEIRAVHRHLQAIASRLRAEPDRYEQGGDPR